MKVIIIGAGFTGTQLAKRLVNEKNDVVLIENDEKVIRYVENRLDCMMINANGNSIKALSDAGIASADALVAVTSSDEINMIICSMVNAAYPKVIKIARVRNYEYCVDFSNSEQAKSLYGIDFIINPDIEASNVIVNAVEHGAITDVVSFENSNFEITNIYVEKGSRLDGVKIQDLRSFINCKFVICYLENEDGAFLPSGSTVVHSDSYIGILTEKSNLDIFYDLTGSKKETLNKIALIGAGKIGLNVANRIIQKKKKSIFNHLFISQKNTGKKFVIIDKDFALTERLALEFPNATVYNADITDESFFEEEKIGSYDLVIATTQNHELNMVTSAYCKSLGVKKTICLVNSSNYAGIARNIGIDIAVPFKDSLVDSIMGHLRGKSVTGLHSISDGDLEIIEFTIPVGSNVSQKALKDIAMPGSFLILLISKGDEYIVPVGNTILQENDKLIFIVHSKDIKLVLAHFGA